MAKSPVPGYRLDKFLGKGTFGEVWRASAPFGVKVALKFIDISGKAGLKEFRGIQRVKDIRHAHLMPITAIWMLDQDGNILDDSALEQLPSDQPPDVQDVAATMSLDQFRRNEDTPKPAVLVVSMLLADMSLAARMEQCSEETGEGIPSDELLDYMDQGARGIDFMNLRDHEIVGGRARIQHCDITPENMLLVGDSVVICDFGLAKLLGGQQKTTTGALGTPAYLAPEVLLSQQPSDSTDQYSFACSYYHLRSGKLPFDSNSSLPHVFEIIKTGKLEFTDVGRCERSVLRKATAVDPKKRYESSAEFVRELRRAIQEDELIDHERSRRIMKWVVTWSIAIILLLAVGGLGALVVTSPQGKKIVAQLLGSREQEDPSGGGGGSQGGTEGGTTGGASGGGTTDFSVVVDPVLRDLEEGQWEEALTQLQKLSPAFPEQVQTHRQQALETIYQEASQDLDSEPEQARRAMGVVLSDLDAHPIEDPTIRPKAQLTLARSAARLNEWTEVSEQLDSLREQLDELNRDAESQFIVLSGARDDS